MHEYYPSHEIAFLMVQHSGTGTGAAALERFEDCVEDIQTWVDYVKKIGYTEIWLQAHSLGAPKIAYYMDMVKPDNIAGLILLSPSEMIGLVHDPIGQKDFDAMYPEAIKLVAENKPDTILSHKLWGENLMSAGTFLNLFDEDTNSAIFNYANPELGWKTVNNTDVPVLAITGTKDDGIATVMEPHLAMKKLESELISSKRVKTIVYDGAEHDFIGFEERLVKDVVEFIQAK